MTITEISKDDFFCRLFVKEKKGKRWECYYKTIVALRPLFISTEFNEWVNGFYLNNQGDFDTVRISYFVDDTNRQKAISVIRQYVLEAELLETKYSPPRKIVLAQKYGGRDYEERFRTFLNLETQIGLDLIKGIFFMQDSYLLFIDGR